MSQKSGVGTQPGELLTQPQRFVTRLEGQGAMFRVVQHRTLSALSDVSAYIFLKQKRDSALQIEGGLHIQFDTMSHNQACDFIILFICATPRFKFCIT
jgi:hypothetical protein